MNLSRTVFVWFFAIVSVVSSANEHWPQFRGEGALGVSSNENLPVEWSGTKNVLWRTDIAGRGWSSPVVWGDRVFVTTVVNHGASEEPKKGLYFGGNRPKPPTTEHEWKVFSIELKTGQVAWEKVVKKAVPTTAIHLKSSFASETPVTDGEHVYVYCGQVGLFCFTHEGKKVWSKEFAPVSTRYGWGTAASPVLHRNRIYIVNDNDEGSYLLALDKRTGDEIWKIERDEKSNWSTPYVWENEKRTEIITPGTGKFRSYDLDGKLLYEFGGGSSITIATPFSKFGLLYVSSGYIGDRKKPMFAIRPGASGDISLADEQNSNDYIAWCQKKAAPYNPTTLVYGELMYVLLDRGFVSCYDAKTGEEIYNRQRLPEGRAFTTSPWAYDGKIFCLNEYGQTFVIKAGREFELLHTNSFSTEELCMATPAIVGDKLIVRTERRLYCIKNGANFKEPPAKETTRIEHPKAGIQTQTYEFKDAGKKMEYAMFVPSSYKPGKAAPLMVALHGLGGNPRQIMGYPGLTKLAEKHGYLVVAPMGYNSTGWYGSRGKFGNGEKSEQDVMNVLEITRKEYNVDSRRIYLMGHSMGGGGTWHLGIKYPEIWAGLAPIAPAIYRSPDALEKIKDTPVIVVQGDKDTLVPVAGARRWVAKMKELGMTHEYIEVKNGGHIRVAFDNLPRIFDFFNEHRNGKAQQKYETN